ncbi:MAG: transferrin receptor-like dimerization domain-containing protein [Rhodothermales bacterium]
MRLPRLLSLAVVASLLAFSPPSANDNDDPILGFSKAGAAAQHELEATFESHLTPANLRVWMKKMTSRPHHVGSAFTGEKVKYMADLFDSWGYDVEIEEFTVLFPTPTERVVELVAPTKFKAKLAMPDLDGKVSDKIKKEILPAYNAFSADGDVTAELVFVNQGIPRDYEELAELGIDVKGKIVIARYGGSWRGIKPKVAAEHGAIGCILYSDPEDDGYLRGDVYPEGAFKPGKGVQRGSVADMPLYPGDPLTPGVGSKPETERYDISAAPTLMKIPVLPISYDDALPLLEAIGGPVAPARWRGALPITYHVGPGPAKVHLKLKFDWKLETAYNVVARMEGSEFPDQWIMRGNHHDAWVFGAADPVSGMVSLMEEARAIGELAKTGWRPKRTIVYAGWDAEEPGLLGSTEWVEYHAAELRDKLAVYINTDGNGRGFWGAGGSHTLERFINEVGREVTDPQTGVSVAERARALRQVRNDAEATSRKDLRISPLGSGSDYTPFLQHLGIASLNLGFGGENPGGGYHTAFDAFDHYERFGDPDFAYGATLANVTGRAVLRLANADILPYSFNNYADNVAKFADEVMKLADTMRSETERENTKIESKAYKLTADPTKHFEPRHTKAAVPFFNFAPLQNALANLETAAKKYDAAMAEHGGGLSPDAQETLNEFLMGIEQRMTRKQGLPRRPWFKHQIYAPGFYTGYGVKTLPGIREALEQRSWDEAAEQIEIVSSTIDLVSEALDEATDMIVD